jgi:hypothetical protein
MQPNTQCFIYILTNTIDDTFYIGSTSIPLDIRFRYHTGELTYFNTVTYRNSRLYTHYDKIGWHNVKISLLHSIICSNFRQLHISETKHILPHLGSPNCLNMKIPFTYYNYRISKCTVLNSSTSEIYQKYIHAYKLDKVLKEYMKMVKIYPTDYIYGRAKYIFSVVLEEFMRFVDYIPPTCSAESTADPLISPSIEKSKKTKTCQKHNPVSSDEPKKRGRPRKHPPPEPSVIQTPKKRGRPRKTPLPESAAPLPKPEKIKKVKVVAPQSEKVPELPSPPIVQLARPKFSKKISKANTDSIVPLTSFISSNLI